MKGKEDRPGFDAAPGAPEDFDIRFTGLESSITTCAACRSSVSEMIGKKMTSAQARARIRRNECEHAKLCLSPLRKKKAKLAMASRSHNRLRLSSMENTTLAEGEQYH
jgi:hypothetical protein